MVDKKFIYMVIFLRKDNDVKYKVGHKIFKKIDKFVEFRKKKYHIPIQSPVFLDGNTWKYFVDIDSNAKYSFKDKRFKDTDCVEAICYEPDESTEFLNADQLTTALNTDIIQNVLKGAKKSADKMDWYSFGVGLLAGALIAGVLVYFLMQGKIDDLISQLTTFNQYQIPY